MTWIRYVIYLVLSNAISSAPINFKLPEIQVNRIIPKKPELFKKTIFGLSYNTKPNGTRTNGDLASTIAAADNFFENNFQIEDLEIHLSGYSFSKGTYKLIYTQKYRGIRFLSIISSLDIYHDQVIAANIRFVTIQPKGGEIKISDEYGMIKYQKMLRENGIKVENIDAIECVFAWFPNNNSPKEGSYTLTPNLLIRSGAREILLNTANDTFWRND